MTDRTAPNHTSETDEFDTLMASAWSHTLAAEQALDGAPVADQEAELCERVGRLEVALQSIIDDLSNVLTRMRAR